MAGSQRSSATVPVQESEQDWTTRAGAVANSGPVASRRSSGAGGPGPDRSAVGAAVRAGWTDEAANSGPHPPSTEPSVGYDWVGEPLCTSGHQATCHVENGRPVRDPPGLVLPEEDRWPTGTGQQPSGPAPTWDTGGRGPGARAVGFSSVSEGLPS